MFITVDFKGVKFSATPFPARAKLCGPHSSHARAGRCVTQAPPPPTNLLHATGSNTLSTGCSTCGIKGLWWLVGQRAGRRSSSCSRAGRPLPCGVERALDIVFAHLGLLRCDVQQAVCGDRSGELLGTARGEQGTLGHHAVLRETGAGRGHISGCKGGDAWRTHHGPTPLRLTGKGFVRQDWPPCTQRWLAAVRWPAWAGNATPAFSAGTGSPERIQTAGSPVGEKQHQQSSCPLIKFATSSRIGPGASYVCPRSCVHSFYDSTVRTMKMLALGEV